MEEIRPLTSVRGVAALWVFLYHLAIALPKSPRFLTGAVLLGRGYLAVDLFFVLSGFVLALTYREMFQRSALATAYPDFLIRRIARIMPLNIAIVAAIAALVWLFPPQDPNEAFAQARHPGVLLANLLLIQDWGVAGSVVKPAWSVSVELAIYCIFPILLRLAWSRCWALPALAGSALLFWLSRMGQGQIDRGFLADSFMGLAGGDFVRGLTGFYFGLLCFRAFQVPRWKAFAGRAALPVVVLFFALLTWSPGDLAPVLLCPALVLALAGNRGLLGRLLNARPLHYLGTISYSIYLTHYCVISAVSLLLGPLDIASGGLTILLTMLVSIAGYHLIERPARRWVRRLGSRAREPTVAEY
jgi:peptidoglycan/LPS O-acetylase OafA/YrhL